MQKVTLMEKSYVGLLQRNYKYLTSRCTDL